ncbi:glycosyltransferase [Akkermansiaceae bacterium]|nr:glycosyltransferase [Akkermansiaceae bacterium]
MRIYTCTPVAFGGGEDFFARDSGLLCRGLQMIGIESRAVMPGERKPEDGADLIRTDYPDLESAAWWKSLGIDGLVLYAWGHPKYHKVAAAIHAAGIPLVLNLDSGGFLSPHVGLGDWLRAQWVYGGQGRGVGSWLRFAKLSVFRFFGGLLVTERLRVRHLECGDAIACVSPGAARYVRRLCHHHGGDGLADRVTVIPHSVEPAFRFPGGNKRRQVACVGRWDDGIQKRTWLLAEVIGRVLETDDEVCFVIAGKAAPGLEKWHSCLPDAGRKRVKLTGMIGRAELVALLGESRVFYSPSAYESFGIAAAEALCSGCSVVAGRSVTMAAFDWFVSEKSGQLASTDDACGHAEALVRELAAWDNGDRDAPGISTAWCARLHADRVAMKVREILKR